MESSSISRIRPMADERSVHVYGWTEVAFLKFVEYESMFIGAKAVRIGRTTWRIGPVLTTGFNGHPVERGETITLHDPDGEVTLWAGSSSPE